MGKNLPGKKEDEVFTKFLNLEPDKRERILNAALSQFTRNGFKKASTNEIIKEANISKGLLFHYFNNKKDLFIFLYDYSLKLIINEFLSKIDFAEKDILLRLRQKALLKAEVAKKHPEIFDFIVIANCEEASEIKDEIKRLTEYAYTANYGKIYEDIDTSKFREGTDIKRAINIINWTIEGIREQEHEKLKQQSYDDTYYEDIVKNMDVYTEILRKCFYKE